MVRKINNAAADLRLNSRNVQISGLIPYANWQGAVPDLSHRGCHDLKLPKSAEIVSSRIRNLIVRGELKPGDNLPAEAELILQYGVSRPTLREAVRILEWEGLIAISRGARRGAAVLAATPDLISRAAGLALQSRGATLGDVYLARSFLEPVAARLAAETRPEEAVRALQVVLDKELKRVPCRNEQDLEEAISEFHQTLMESCGNATLAMLAYALSDLIDRHQNLVYSRRQLDKETPQQKKLRWQQILHGVKSHARLVKIIQRGDGDAAEDHWRKHMTGAGKFWLKNIAHKSVIDVLEEL